MEREGGTGHGKIREAKWMQLRIRLSLRAFSFLRQLAASGVDPRTRRKPTLTAVAAAIIDAHLESMYEEGTLSGRDRQRRHTKEEAEALGLSPFKRPRARRGEDQPTLHQRVKVWDHRIGRYVYEQEDGEMPEPQ